MSDQTNDKKRGRGWVRILLIVSLALNLTVVGLAVGAAIGFGKMHRPEASTGHGSPILRALTREERRDMGRSIRKAYRDFEREGGNGKGQMEALIAAVESDPFDEGALREARDVLDARTMKRREVAADVWLDYVAGMAPAERKDYAARMRHALEHKRDHEKKPRKD